MVLAAVLFGTTGTAQALGPQSSTPLGVGAMRIAVGGVALAALAFWLAAVRARRSNRTRPTRTPRALLLMLLTGAGLAAYQPLFFVGTDRNGVAVGTVIALGSAPVIAGVIEWAVTKRTPSGIWMLATSTAMAGVLLLGVSGGVSATGVDLIGVVGSLGAGTCFAVFANAQRVLLRAGWDPFLLVGAMGASAAIPAIVALPFLDVAWLGEPGGTVMVLWLGLATIAAAYSLFTWGLQGMSAATAATLTLAEPLTAALLGIGVLGERLSSLGIVAVMVLGAGLTLLAWGSGQPRDPDPFAVEG